MMITPQQSDWYSPIEGKFVTLTFWNGWKAATKQNYPCPTLRLVDADTEEVIEEIPGNGKVSLNTIENVEELEDFYKCQFCGDESPIKEWGRDGHECPKCKKEYDAILAQDSEG